ncbi:DUF3139 domain-containing protein [Paenibacillus chitinolyticus]|uniref:DUF3139 domain-containing protein n=1 Tax=Paenibacillus chitinolyticus TaxID=79263 RepID=UPI0036682EDC
MRIIKRTILLVISLLFLFIGSIIVFMNLTAAKLENEVRSYLTSKGYEEHQIQKMDGKISIQPVYQVVVIFADEPNVTYYYGSKKYYSILPSEGEDKVFQLSVTRFIGQNYEYKHIEPNVKEQIPIN